MHLSTLLHLPLLSLPLTLATTLTLTLPSTLPPLSPSTRAQLTTHNHHLTAPLTQSRTFRFTNLTTPATYNLDIYSRDYDFEGSVVVVVGASSTGANTANDVEIYRRSLKNGGRGARMPEAGEKGNKRVELRVRGIKAYYEERQGCTYLASCDDASNEVDPEMKAEFEEQQKKSVVGNVAGGGNPLSGFDMAGWMAGQTSGGGAAASGREIEEDKGSGQGQGQGKSKGRRRG
ncbi:MAG: hypothetical protein LQ339_003208 [Xanthoria mediterranea]|nr:MAG: hypothetical protein LQ339_003208 [Xanthoria mediterranea]